jgi:hypothetical protein
MTPSGESDSVRVASLTMTCPSHPSQWQGHLEDGSCVYIRYRWGRLQWGFGGNFDQATENSIDCKGVVLGDKNDGEISLPDALAAAGFTYDA